jgi:hypothetical protein
LALFVLVVNDQCFKTFSEIFGELRKFFVELYLPALNCTERSNSVINFDEVVIIRGSLIWPFDEAQDFGQPLPKKTGPINRGIETNVDKSLSEFIIFSAINPVPRQVSEINIYHFEINPTFYYN